MRKRFRGAVESQLGFLHVVRRRGRFLHKPSRHDLLVLPAPATQQAVGDPRQVARRHAQAVRRVPPVLRVAIRAAAIKILKRPMLDADRPEQHFDGELVVGLAGHVLADQ
jgi:hypothetical protein